jgi:hypothetical protein
MSAQPSQLDLMIARLTMQRDCLDLAARLIGDLPGPVLEIGLGKGRTYDHLRRRLPEREIIALDRDLHAPAAAAPEGDQLVLGEFFPCRFRDHERRRRRRPGALAGAAAGPAAGARCRRPQRPADGGAALDGAARPGRRLALFHVAGRRRPGLRHEAAPVTALGRPGRDRV